MQGRFGEFTVLISTINRCIRKLKTEEMAEFALKSPHVSCVYYLYNAGDLTATRLCEICGEDKAAVSRSLEYLEKNGLVSCQSDTKKRYKSALSLTEKGKEVGRRLVEKINGILQKAGEGLSEEHRAVMYQSLTIISENLQKLCEDYDK